MRKLMICVTERPDNQAEIGVFEEKSPDGTEFERRVLATFELGFQVLCEEVVLFDSEVGNADMLVKESPSAAFERRVRDRFQRQREEAIREHKRRFNQQD